MLDQLLAGLAPVLQACPDVRFAALFGSAGTRGPDLAHDVDIAISFSRSPSWMELGALEGEVERVIGKRVDLIDLDTASTLLRWEVLQRGRLITARDRDAWLAFQTRVQFEYDDLRPFLEREGTGLRRVLERARWSEST